MATNSKRWIAPALAVLFCATPAATWAPPELHAQPCGANCGFVRGCAVDGAGVPVRGATIRLKGTTQGAIARADGSFLIANVRAGVYRVTATCVGRQTVEAVLVVAPITDAWLDVVFIHPWKIDPICPWPHYAPLQRPIPYATVRRIELQK